MIKEISKEQALFCVKQSEFGDEILLSAQNVAVILTQSWCPQWLAMKDFLGEITGCDIYALEYDRTDYFDLFRQFKEDAFANDQVPYIRYYRNGRLIHVSNYVSEQEFTAHLGL